MNDRRLTSIVGYVTLRLFARPFFGYLWFIWLAFVFLMVSVNGARPMDAEYGQTRLIAAIAGIGIVVGLCRVSFLLFSKSGRRWLFSAYSDNDIKSASVGSKILVRSVPFVALAALIQFLR
jgi:hypothetical protein